MLNSSLLQLIWLPNTTKKIVWHGRISIYLSIYLSVSIFSKVKNKKYIYFEICPYNGSQCPPKQFG